MPDAPRMARTKDAYDSSAIVTFLFELPGDLGLTDGATIFAPEKREDIEFPLFPGVPGMSERTDVDTRFVFRRTPPHLSSRQTVALDVFEDFWEGLEFVDSLPGYQRSRAALPTTVVAATTGTISVPGEAVTELQLTLIFDKVLRQLNQFLTMLGFSSGEADIGAVRRTELPPFIPVVLDLPFAGQRQLELLTLQVHRFGWEDRANDPSAVVAADLAFRDREGDWPFAPVVTLLHRARRDRYAGDLEQSVIGLVTATELLVEIVIDGALRAAGEDDRIAGVLQAGFANIMRNHLRPLVERTGGDPGAVDIWLSDCYSLRKQVAHDGYVPSPDEVRAASLATFGLSSEVVSAMRNDPALAALGALFPVG